MSWYHEHLTIGPLTIFGANAMHFAFAIGPGLDAGDKRGAKIRRQKYGHGFDTDQLVRDRDGVWT